MKEEQPKPPLWEPKPKPAGCEDWRKGRPCSYRGNYAASPKECINSVNCKGFDPDLCKGFRSCYNGPGFMKLQQIVDAVRRGELPSYEDLRYAIVAYDVLIYLLHLDKDPERLAEYFKAAESIPKEYTGPNNDPEKLDVVAWARAMQGIK